MVSTGSDGGGTPERWDGQAGEPDGGGEPFGRVGDEGSATAPASTMRSKNDRRGDGDVGGGDREERRWVVYTLWKAAAGAALVVALTPGGGGGGGGGEREGAMVSAVGGGGGWWQEGGGSQPARWCHLRGQRWGCVLHGVRGYIWRGIGPSTYMSLPPAHRWKVCHECGSTHGKSSTCVRRCEGGEVVGK